MVVQLVIVVGVGVVGLIVVFLFVEMGMCVMIIEQLVQMSEVGVGFQILVNGVCVFDRFGVLLFIFL